jgi:hypothetical protein
MCGGFAVHFKDGRRYSMVTYLLQNGSTLRSFERFIFMPALRQVAGGQRKVCPKRQIGRSAIQQSLFSFRRFN